MRSCFVRAINLAALCLVFGADSGGGPIFPADDDAKELAPTSVLKPIPGLTTAPTTQQFPFYPIAGNLDRDLLITNYVDLDPSAGLLDWDCTTITYDGHNGNDIIIRSFAEQVLGVPIFAALDGTVSEAHDGEFDMQTTLVNPPPNANYVAISHGGGLVTYYLHMKKDSVAVRVGDFVRAGRQIGLVGSSGRSTWPHLHFAPYQNGQLFEPHAGTCRTGPSNWVHQAAIDRTTHLIDAGVTYEDINTYPGLPFALPHSSQVATGDPYVYFWIEMANLPVNASRQFRFRRPSGTVAFDTGALPLNNAAYRLSWWWYRYTIGDMHSITGTWHIELLCNGVQLISLPVEVVTTRDSGFNRIPEPITVSFDPPAPTPNEAVFCRVSTSTLDDKDYDVVRYEFVWTLNGVEVRHVTTAGVADAIPHHSVCGGSTLTCTVTPRDTASAGPSASVTVTVAGQSPRGDLDCDGDVDQTDFARLQTCLSGSNTPQLAPGCQRARLDGDDDVDADDVVIFTQCAAGPDVLADPVCGN